MLRRSPLKRKSRLRRKSPKSKQRDLADYIWGTIVILRDKVCIYCGKNPATHPHHIFAKGQCPAVRHDIQNGAGACGGCHTWKVHTNPEGYRHINIKHVGGEDEYERLKIRAFARQSSKDYKLMELDLLNKLANYVNVSAGWNSLSWTEKMAELRLIRKKS